MKKDYEIMTNNFNIIEVSSKEYLVWENGNFKIEDMPFEGGYSNEKYYNNRTKKIIQFIQRN